MGEAKVDGTQPTEWTLRQIKEVIKPELFERSTAKALTYLARDVALSSTLAYATYVVDGRIVASPFSQTELATVSRVIVWGTYWWFQSLLFTGMWILGHECAHGAFSPSSKICDVVGFTIHTLLGTPYYNWKHSHAAHHQNHANAERLIENPAAHGDPEHSDIWEVIEDSPAYLLVTFAAQQLIDACGYLESTALGHAAAKPFITPSSLFRGKHAAETLLSDAGFLALAQVLLAARSALGTEAVLRLYVVPWALLSHWIFMTVLLQHNDPSMPRRRADRKPSARGVLSTMDRPFLGWQGKFFLHNIAHCHLVHHLFPKLPFYNALEATEQVKVLLGDDYKYADTPVLEAFWINFRRCDYEPVETTKSNVIRAI
ncbi:hypothetical protein BV25DRAFT_1920704 [Artomyces pyxidatus]|uniref:Uncharacterized protein n=1 Tax=Artomyces pyxidatus TaxID=48021 RepID=A0ACB8SK63_9AGAM|nr:hypothetical protein BV25DRAFT_1920704 [Artomyces pyxidatus]